MNTTFVLLGCAAVLAQTMPPGITRTQILDNASVMIARLTMAPGARETTHTHPFSAVVVQLDAGEVEMRVGTKAETARRPSGDVQFLAAEMPHAAANVGTAPFDVVTIALKPDRARGGTQPVSPAPAGITRALVLDNAEARVARATFAPGSREPVHTHPFDMVLVAMGRGRIELLLGEEQSVKDYAAGDVLFLPRDVPHAVASADQKPFEMLSVGIK